MREANLASESGFPSNISEGIAQPARADASHASGRRRKSSCPHHFTSLWCSPANTPASHAGDHRSEAGQGGQLHRRVVYGEQQTHLTQNQVALDVQVVSRRPFSEPPKHCQRCTRPVREFSLGQLQVGAPALVAVCQGARPPGPQSSQRSSRFHKPAQPRAALGIATIFRAASINE